MPRGWNVFALFIKWASRAFLIESRLLRMSWMGIRRTSVMEWPAWLKCSDTGVVVLSCWWFRIDRWCSPKRSLSWRSVSPMYWRWHYLNSIRYMRCFEWQDMESVILLASLVVKKGIACLTLSEKRASEAAWVVAFFNSCRFLAGEIFVRQCTTMDL